MPIHSSEPVYRHICVCSAVSGREYITWLMNILNRVSKFKPLVTMTWLNTTIGNFQTVPSAKFLLQAFDNSVIWFSAITQWRCLLGSCLQTDIIVTSLTNRPRWTQLCQNTNILMTWPCTHPASINVQINR